MDEKEVIVTIKSPSRWERFSAIVPMEADEDWVQENWYRVPAYFIDAIEESDDYDGPINITDITETGETYMSNRYRIVRHHFKNGSETIKTGLTLEEAQEHCQREDTHGDGWFDGYTEE